MWDQESGKGMVLETPLMQAGYSGYSAVGLDLLVGPGSLQAQDPYSSLCFISQIFFFVGL